MTVSNSLFVAPSNGEDLADRLDHLRFTSIAWLGDGFFYVRWPETEPGSTAPVKDPSVHYHRIGTEQADDPLVFHNDGDPEPICMVELTEDLRYLVLADVLGTDRRNGLLYLDLAVHGDTICPVAPSIRLHGFGWSNEVSPPTTSCSMLPTATTAAFVQTDRDAPNGRIVAVDLAAPDPDAWITLVAETEHALEWSAARGRTAAQPPRRGLRSTHPLLDRRHRARSFLPGLGTITGLAGRFAEPAVFLGYQSFVELPTVLRAQDGVTEVWAGSEPPIDPSDLVVERMHAVSTDGAEVGMFVVRRADAESRDRSSCTATAASRSTSPRPTARPDLRSSRRAARRRRQPSRRLRAR